ncbi:clock-controlled pheromone ccg-4 precursor [Cordyceps militaris]|uniref:Clock-controlled pheromone ccg-4 n=1 Tax=Cordyceps militaris TaxID=73501 RepID=A0A2H4SKT2_CORMI|nr:clock-controlled pheromone ccg-4 precursor [Cordyceps militaris]
MKFEFAALLALAATGLAAPSPWCTRPGQPCWKLKRAVEAVDAHADAEAAADGMGLIASVAYDRLVELAAQGSPDPAAFYEQHRLQKSKRDVEAAAAIEKRWCTRPGEPCWKRAVEEQDELSKRWCLRPGQPCWKAKRAAESVLEAGQEDSTEECGEGDEQCSNAKRSLENLHQVARAIVEAF